MKTTGSICVLLSLVLVSGAPAQTAETPSKRDLRYWQQWRARQRGLHRTPTPAPPPTRPPNTTPSPTATATPGAPPSGVYGIASDGMKLTWEVTMPAVAPGIKVPACLMIKDEHWAIDEQPPGGVTSALVGANMAAIWPHHHVVNGSQGQYPTHTDDLTMAAQAARRDARFNGQVVAIGGSGGGADAGWLAAKGLVDAAVLLSPATYLPDLVSGGGVPAQKALAYAPTQAAQIGASMTTYIKQGVSSPMMNVFAKVDEMPDNQRTDLDTALSKNNIVHQSILLDMTGHGWGLYKYVDWLGFLKSHLPSSGGSPSPTPTPTPPPPTQTPTPTSSPTVTPSATPIVTIRHAHGPFYLLNPDDATTAERLMRNRAWNSTSCSGVRLRMGANQIVTAPGKYDWTVLMAASQRALATGKQWSVGIQWGPNTPGFVGAKWYTLSDGTQSPVPWDKNVLGAELAFIKAFGLQFASDPNLVEVVIGGLGTNNGFESYVAHNKADTDALKSAGGAGDWLGSCNSLAAATVAAFPNTAVVATIAHPWPGDDASLQSFVDTQMRLYPNFGAMDSALKALSDTHYLPNGLIDKYSPTHPCGFQFVASSKDSRTGDFLTALNKGVDMLHGRGKIEIYAADADDPTKSALISGLKTQLQ